MFTCTLDSIRNGSRLIGSRVEADDSVIGMDDTVETCPMSQSSHGKYSLYDTVYVGDSAVVAALQNHVININIYVNE